MTVLVTGGSGFIGRALVRRLVSEGHRVTVADRAPFPGPEPMCHVPGDLRRPTVVESALEEGTSAVFHLAGVTSVLESQHDPIAVYEAKVAVTAALLERARQVGASSFVLASTNAVVGDVGDNRIDERSPLRPLTPYGATKAAAEMLCSAYGASYAMAAGAVRYLCVGERAGRAGSRGHRGEAAGHPRRPSGRRDAIGSSRYPARR